MTPAELRTGPDRPGVCGSLFDELPVPASDPGAVGVAAALAGLVAASGATAAPAARARDDQATLWLGPQSVVLRGLALAATDALASAIDQVAALAPWRRMTTPGGLLMSVSLTNCGALGWTSDRHGYRYSPHDPLTGLPWPPMPAPLQRLASEAATRAGFAGFAPDACLVNAYAPGTRLSLHQDRDEADLRAPIVSVSLGLPATFLFGGLRRTDPTVRVVLNHGDVMVWGGVDRLRFHGVAPVRRPAAGMAAPMRWNLTFRKAG